MAADDKSQNGAAKTPQEASIQVLGQYIKDLSFENPSAPQSFQQQPPNPKLDINFGVGVREVGPNVHEVTLNVENKLATEKQVLFQLQLDYAGAFRIEGLPPELLHQVLHVQCPTLLFPFVRRLVADLTRDGGFPQLYLDPIDFAALYRMQMARSQGTQPQAMQA